MVQFVIVYKIKYTIFKRCYVLFIKKNPFFSAQIIERFKCTKNIYTIATEIFYVTPYIIREFHHKVKKEKPLQNQGFT